MPCHTMAWHGMACNVTCHAMPCHSMPCHAMSCNAHGRTEHLHAAHELDDDDPVVSDFAGVAFPARVGGSCDAKRVPFHRAVLCATRARGRHTRARGNEKKRRSIPFHASTPVTSRAGSGDLTPVSGSAVTTQSCSPRQGEIDTPHTRTRAHTHTRARTRESRTPQHTSTHLHTPPHTSTHLHTPRAGSPPRA